MQDRPRPGAARRAFAACGLLAFVPALVGAQVRVLPSAYPAWVGTPVEDYERVLEVAGRRGVTSRLVRGFGLEAGLAAPESAGHPWSARMQRASTPDGRGPWVRAFHPTMLAVHNSVIPRGMNDGPLWAGRGTSGAVTLGGEAAWGPLHVRVAPTLWGARNAAFALGRIDTIPGADSRFGRTSSPYADPFLSRRVDLPQRFGSAAIARLDPGQSGVRLSGRGLAAGFATTGMWWGPGVESALLMTSNAGAIPHWFAGTSRPLRTPLGRVGASYMLGRLTASDHWIVQADTLRDRRWMSGLLVTWEPRWAPNLSLGAGRVFYAYEPPGGLRASDYLAVLQPVFKKQVATHESPEGNDERDQMLALFARWVLPAAGVELYGEYGRNDHSWDARDLTLEPDHSRAYLAGLQKVFAGDGTLDRLRVEVTKLSRPQTAEYRASPYWYGHHVVRQGYTQRGQLVGSGLGLGAEAQSLAYDRFTRRGRIGGSLRRTRFHNDAFYDRYRRRNGAYDADAFERHHVELAAALGATWFAGPLDLGVDVDLARQWNRYFVRNNDVRNIGTRLTATWRLP